MWFSSRHGRFLRAELLRYSPIVRRESNISVPGYLARDVNASIMLALVGLSGLEPPTSRLSGVRSNRLSYKPISWPEANRLFAFTLAFSSACPHVRDSQF